MSERGQLSPSSRTSGEALPGPSERSVSDPPSRADLARAERRTLKSAGTGKAELYEISHAGRRLVIKDFAGKPAWARLTGRLQIRRECAAYRWLGGLPGLPRLVGRIDGHALALEKVDGRSLREWPAEDAARIFARLGGLVERLHERGLAHLDLRGQDNVLVDERGEVWILDLAASVRLRPGGLAHRWLFPPLARIDDAALLKWKALLDLGPYSEAERRFLDRFGRRRRLWPFNRKRRARSPESE